MMENFLLKILKPLVNYELDFIATTLGDECLDSTQGSHACSIAHGVSETTRSETLNTLT